ncbi:radical SAM protein [Candidatus Woesearchaeota archaeon]|nr:radical SAM protein [Candidatus Woesearchaeota archaeon]
MPGHVQQGKADGGRQLQSATFLVKYDCNLNCKFCLNDWRGKKRPNDELAFEQQKQALQKLRDAGVRHVTFTGGEPTLHPRIADLIRHAHSLGMTTLLQTNGTRITDEFLRAVQSFIGGIQVSLEGLRDEQKAISRVDCFDGIVANMRKIKQHGIKLFTNFTITKLNKHCLKDYLALLDDIGVDVASFTRLYPAGRAIDNWQELVISGEEYAAFLRELKEIEKTSKTRIYLAGPTDTAFLLDNGLDFSAATCSAGRNEIAINPNGDILPCPSWNKPVGNIVKTDVKAAWEQGFLADLGEQHDGTQGCMLARARSKTELEPPVVGEQALKATSL